ncbi:unnamed protein product [Sphenostylis stenocarpa]|uniref:Uncharacterized protein n=1 Tax=Sphenostylis stenocarpa TaxID=92480 RepID=A0AA86SI42_9FABA|nr:unnamed protein product [Sphenostylis stenocarpa]
MREEGLIPTTWQCKWLKGDRRVTVEPMKITLYKDQMLLQCMGPISDLSKLCRVLDQILDRYTSQNKRRGSHAHRVAVGAVQPINFTTFSVNHTSSTLVGARDNFDIE